MKSKIRSNYESPFNRVLTKTTRIVSSSKWILTVKTQIIHFIIDHHRSESFLLHKNLCLFESAPERILIHLWFDLNVFWSIIDWFILTSQMHRVCVALGLIKLEFGQLAIRKEIRKQHRHQPTCF